MCRSKILTDLCFTKQEIKTKNGFVEKGIIEFENHFKQIPVPLKIYADFECNLRSESYEGSYTKKYQDHVPCSFAWIKNLLIMMRKKVEIIIT